MIDCHVSTELGVLLEGKQVISDKFLNYLVPLTNGQSLQFVLQLRVDRALVLLQIKLQLRQSLLHQSLACVLLVCSVVEAVGQGHCLEHLAQIVESGLELGHRVVSFLQLLELDEATATLPVVYDNICKVFAVCVNLLML